MDPNPSLAPQLSSPKLSVRDLSWVMKKYYEHRNEWYNIGIALLIDEGTLDTIQQYRHERFEDCFRDMLLTWLRSEKPATESQLINATRKVRVSSLIRKSCIPSTNVLVIVVDHHHYEYLSVMSRTLILLASGEPGARL